MSDALPVLVSAPATSVARCSPTASDWLATRPDRMTRTTQLISTAGVDGRQRAEPMTFLSGLTMSSGRD
jgi:hypothetical protein